MNPRKGVGNDVFFARFVQDFAVIIDGSFHPTKLTLIQVWLRLELYEGAVVCVDFEMSSKEKGVASGRGRALSRTFLCRVSGNFADGG